MIPPIVGIAPTPWRSWRPWRFTLFALLLVSAAKGQCPGGVCPLPDRPTVSRGEQIDPAAFATVSCRIQHEARGMMSCGSGTVIASRGDVSWVLTCHHLFSDGSGRTTCLFVDGTSRPAKIIADDTGHDLALLELTGAASQSAIVATTRQQGTFTACGFGVTGRLRALRGPLVGLANTQNAHYPSLQIAATVMSGDSGGGVFDGEGKLCGVIWGVRDGIAYATPLEPIRELLRRLPNQPMAPAGSDPVEAPSTPDPHAAWRAGIDTRLSELDARIGSVAQQIPDPLAQPPRIDPLPVIDNKIATMREQILVDARSAATVVVREGLKQLPTAAAWSLPELLIGGASVGSPIGVGLLAIGVLLRHRAAKSHTASEHTTQRIVMDSPPVSQMNPPETHYVPYEKQTFPDAYQWASSQVARKFPGAVETLTTLDSLIKQQLSGKSRE